MSRSQSETGTTCSRLQIGAKRLKQPSSKRYSDDISPLAAPHRYLRRLSRCAILHRGVPGIHGARMDDLQRSILLSSGKGQDFSTEGVALRVDSYTCLR